MYQLRRYDVGRGGGAARCRVEEENLKEFASNVEDSAIWYMSV
jgi:hypothetical protein